MANPPLAMCPRHIHQLERAAFKGMGKMHVSLDLTWNYSNACSGVNPPDCNLVVPSEHYIAHMTYLIPTELYSFVSNCFIRHSSVKSIDCVFWLRLSQVCQWGGFWGPYLVVIIYHSQCI